MTYSKIHQKFSELLNQPDALTDPEKYLGPNYQDVLNFWFYAESLSYLDKQEIDERYYFNVRLTAIDASNKAADDVVGWKIRYSAWGSAYDVIGMQVFARATVELIGSHKILEQGKTPTVLPLTVKKPSLLKRF